MNYTFLDFNQMYVIIENKMHLSPSEIFSACDASLKLSNPESKFYHDTEEKHMKYNKNAY